MFDGGYEMAVNDGNRQWIIGGVLAAAVVAILAGAFWFDGNAEEGGISDNEAETSAPAATDDAADADDEAEEAPATGTEAAD
jgi:hypothetical protein